MKKKVEPKTAADQPTKVVPIAVKPCKGVPKAADRTIIITCTILPLKGKQRPVLVSAAPQGEMPIVFKGVFQELHGLINQAFGQVVKRDPQVVTVKTAKSAETKTTAAKRTTVTVVETDALEGASEISDQSVSEPEVSEDAAESTAPTGAQTVSENLPEIEGDETEDNDG